MSEGGGGIGGKLISVGVFIGVLILLNVLSMAFDWGYYFY